MYKAKDGKKFGSGFAGKRYDENHSSDGMHKMGGEEKESPDVSEETKEPRTQNEQETPEEDNAESRTDENGENKDSDADGQGEAEQVVAEHGPAHHVHISHHEGGKSHVMSHHSTGFTHISEHESPEEAHETGRKLAGVPADGQAKDHDSPYHQGKDQAGASSEEDGFSMPDLV